ncbi:ELM1/GtrOC1 family putative glycosyltransferase [Solimonas marina]|uniref:Nucleoside-diphosphate sugar epimerase n=1 Tax=Solimonas marina TaxID=2714601 RepID=A0A969WAW5_9GAMM|nr:ELM1/GtrOC1 family putative glycosyltransferase [Solimonas marina]NKF23607.1 hypothetical protein [Solimonas marina]
MATDAAVPVWLLTGTRPGEITQQRALAHALGLPFRELAVARQPLAGGHAEFDFAALQPPWPKIAISFGKTLDAAVELRHRAPQVRLVQIGRPRGVAWDQIDLIVPMPQDVIPDGDNIQKIRMPFNPAPPAPDAAIVERLHAQDWPRPWTLLVLGGVSRQYRFDAATAGRLLAATTARVERQRGTLLIATSPRTPNDVLRLLDRRPALPGETYRFVRGDAQNPFAAYLHQADEIVLSGDSPSMLAECWRSTKPVWVWPLRYTPRYWLKRQSRHLIPQATMRAGRSAAALDINRWLRQLADDGHIGLFGQRAAQRPYRAEDDDDLARVVGRIQALLR